MSVANIRGGFTKTLEISRDNSNRSQTMLRDDFLKKTENYTLNVTNFITSTAPVLNTIDEIMFRVLARGNTGETVFQAIAREPPFLTASNRMFTPKPYRTWMELARQLDVFFRTLSLDFFEAYPDVAVGPIFSTFYVRDDGKMGLRLSKEFCGGDTASIIAVPAYKGLYIAVGEETQIKLGLPPYLFQVAGAGNLILNHTTHPNDLLADNGAGINVFSNHQAAFTGNQFDNTNMFEFLNGISLSNMDERLSLDVYSTFPTKSKISAYDGSEEHEFLLFRFPFIDQHNFTNEVSFNEENLFEENIMVTQNLDVGLTDYCANEFETVHQLLLPGTIRAVNLKLMVRYLRHTTVVEKEINFSNGFWYLRLLFVKKVT